MIVLDTHALIWLRAGDGRFGRRARSAVDRAWTGEGVAISAISFWEVAMLQARNRLRLPGDAGSWRHALLQEGFVEIPVDGGLGVRAGALGDLPGDPCDRIIVATALESHLLVTADRRILDWSGPVSRLDATE